ncbi:MAG: sensor histidine kinase [Bacteroidales bacterium]|nr:sensor histidine kinase [Bacteroidales bacterium]MBN2818773.1 sensor histidine kinase [Bacteroidales bacterium]
MNTISPKQQAIIIAIISSICTILAGILVFLFEIGNLYATFVFVGLVVFLVVYLLVYYSLNNFIFNKLKPIYKTIQSIHFSEEQLRADLEERDRDLVKEVQDDVLKWAKRKTHEIAQLKQLEKYRREFLGDVSHELKTPIFNIQGYITTLIDGGIHDDTINMKYLERAEKSVNRLITIVDDLESISRLESGELKLEQQKFNIVKLVEDVFEEYEMLARERKIKLAFANKTDKPVFVFADKQKIYEVLSNLVVNSIKYGNKGGTTKVDFLDMEDNILVEIADNGIGIAEKDLPRIFERFFRTDKSRSREMGGSGLGLSIVKHIIEAHNQTVNVRSKLNQGSAFNFTLSKV